ncbi:hypothetical protein ASC83_10980 [Acidovorax sp. Root402]|nr:hypothetical protein ASC83_10980 [Acidovorax sp. Root402]
MEAWGASADDIDKVRARIDAAANAPPAEGKAFGVYAENLPVVAAFVALAPRWQHVSQALEPAGLIVWRTGFDWAAVEAWIDRHCRRRKRRALSNDLQIMERAALQADREQREKEE